MLKEAVALIRHLQFRITFVATLEALLGEKTKTKTETRKRKAESTYRGQK
jgi:hypothetical protein